jgi:hypothetical protein
MPFRPCSRKRAEQNTKDKRAMRTQMSANLHERKDAEAKLQKEVDVERAMAVLSDTVQSPAAVVIKAPDTAVAQKAVPGAQRLQQEHEKERKANRAEKYHTLSVWQ